MERQKRPRVDHRIARLQRREQPRVLRSPTGYFRDSGHPSRPAIELISQPKLDIHSRPQAPMQRLPYPIVHRGSGRPLCAARAPSSVMYMDPAWCTIVGSKKSGAHVYSALSTVSASAQIKFARLWLCSSLRSRPYLCLITLQVLLLCRRP